MIEVVLLAVALAMDAFAVAIGLGAKSQKQSKQYLWRLAVYAALYFGIAQGVMPYRLFIRRGTLRLAGCCCALDRRHYTCRSWW